jgi:hypothetical protein
VCYGGLISWPELVGARASRRFGSLSQHRALEPTRARFDPPQSCPESGGCDRPARLTGLVDIGVDEISWRKHHKYLTLVSDHNTSQIVWGTTGRTAAALDRFFDELPDGGAEQIEAVSMALVPRTPRPCVHGRPKRCCVSTHSM